MAAITFYSFKKSYKLLNDQLITADSEKLGFPKAFCPPSFLGKKSCGIHEATLNSVIKCVVDFLKNDLYVRRVLSGC